jgi:hypothetical protein
MHERGWLKNERGGLVDPEQLEKPREDLTVLAA